MEPNWDEIRKCWVKLKLLSIHHSYPYMVPGTVWKFHMAMGTCSHWTFVRFPSPCLITDARDALGVAKTYSSNLDLQIAQMMCHGSFRISMDLPSQTIASWRLAQLAIPASMVGKSVSNGCERWFSESCIIFSCCSRNIWGFGRVESLPPQTWNHATPSFTVLGPPCPIPIYSRGNCRAKQNWQRGRETKAEGILNQQLEAEAILQTSFIFKWRVNGSLGLRPAFAWHSHQFLMMQHLPFKWIIYRWSTVCQIWIHCQPRLLEGFEHDESWIVHKLRWLP